jgi:hypothetical protein
MSRLSMDRERALLDMFRDEDNEPSDMSDRYIDACLEALEKTLETRERLEPDGVRRYHTLSRLGHSTKGKDGARARTACRHLAWIREDACMLQMVTWCSRKVSSRCMEYTDEDIVSAKTMAFGEIHGAIDAVWR